MQPKQFFFTRSHWPLLLFTVIICLLPGFYSCSDGGKKENTGPTCVKLTKNQIQKWVENGYADPKGSNYMATVHFHTAYAEHGNAFRVFAVGHRMDGSAINESLSELTALDSCNKKHIDLKRYIFTGTVPVALDKLNIVKNGKVNDSLSYLRIAPYTYYDSLSRHDILAYHCYAHKQGGIMKLFKLGLDAEASDTVSILRPCPPCPNCPTPCPPPTRCPAPDCMD